MPSRSRRLNYTERKRIKRPHARVILRNASDTSDPRSFDATLDLGSYSLPKDARVVVEAYRSAIYQRFDFGTVTNLQPPEDRTLTEFGSWGKRTGEGVNFRVKVIKSPSDDDASSDGLARILAQADQLTPEEAGKRQSLLPLENWDSKDEVWRLRIDPNASPILEISDHLVRDRFAFVRSPAFVSLAMPEIVRRVLQAAVADGIPDDEDGDHSWQSKWVRFACDLVGVSEPPEVIEDDEDERARWIDDVARRFSRRHQIARRFRETTESGGAS